MNCAPCLNTVFCERCGDEHHLGQLNDEGYCAPCAETIAALILAELAADTQAEADALAKCDANNADRATEFEPRSAYVS